MDLDYQAIEIKQEDEDRMDITALEELDHSFSYVSNEHDKNWIKDEPSMEKTKQSELISDAEKYMKVEEIMLVVDVKIEEQESGSYMDSPKPELLTEEFYIKPENDSNDENSSSELVRAVKENVRGKEYGVVHRNADKRLFVCCHCNFIVYNKKDLINHMNVGNCRLNGHKILKNKFDIDEHVIKAKVGNLASHMSKHAETGSSVKPQLCIHCDKAFKSKKGLDDHVIKNHIEYIESVSSKIHECKYCGYKTTHVSSFTKHIGKHSIAGCNLKQLRCVERFQCIHCDKIFKRKHSLQDHILRNHIEFIESVSSKIHECKHCTYKTIDSFKLACHMSKHPESGCSVKQFPCYHCDKTYKSKKYLEDHIIKNHEDFIASVSSKIHQCKHCSYKTVFFPFLTVHMEKHLENGSSVQQFPCIHCDKTFKRKRGLDDHMKKHTCFIQSVPSKIYRCEHCSYESVRVNNLARHMTKHPETGSNVKLFPCIHCDTTFKSKQSLDYHIIKKHSEFIGSVSSKIHQCEHCSYKTTISKCIARHMMMHHPETGSSVERLPCIHCGRTFDRKMALDEHIIKNHIEFIASVSSKIHQCKYCSYKTTRVEMLVRHMTNHPETDSTV